jgi:tetratricopeptide (TPR) repeat protein
VSAAAQTTADNTKPAIAQPANTTAATAPDPLANAEALMNKRQFEEAAAAYQVILDKDPTSAAANAGLVRSLLSTEKLEAATAAATRAVTAAPSSAMVHVAAGDVAFRDGRFADTETEYRTALKLDPKDARAQLGIGRMLQMVSMNKRAKDTFAKAHELDPNDSEITEYWLESLPFSEHLDQLSKIAGNHPTPRQKEQIELLTAVAHKNLGR